MSDQIDASKMHPTSDKVVGALKKLGGSVEAQVGSIFGDAKVCM